MRCRIFFTEKQDFDSEIRYVWVKISIALGTGVGNGIAVRQWENENQTPLFLQTCTLNVCFTVGCLHIDRSHHHRPHQVWRSRARTIPEPLRNIVSVVHWRMSSMPPLIIAFTFTTAEISRGFFLFKVRSHYANGPRVERMPLACDAGRDGTRWQTDWMFYVDNGARLNVVAANEPLRPVMTPAIRQPQDTTEQTYPRQCLLFV